MTEPAATGTVTSDNPQAAKPVTPNGSGGTGQNWIDGLSEGNRNLVKAKNWGTLDDALAGYTNLEAALSSSTRLPAKDAKPEEWQEAFNKVRPEKPDGYQFTMPQGLPENFPYDKGFSEEVKAWMHEAGVHPLQADKLHAKWVQKYAGEFKTASQAAADQKAAEDKAVTDAHNDLVKAWGSPETEGYKQAVSYIDRAMQSEPGLFDAFKQAGALADDGAVKNPTIAKALAKWSRQLFAEDTLHKGDAVPEPNPFMPESLNLTKQGALVRQDPQRAKQLLMAAGKKPVDYGL
jgi:hypothetical protein